MFIARGTNGCRAGLIGAAPLPDVARAGAGAGAGAAAAGAAGGPALSLRPRCAATLYAPLFVPGVTLPTARWRLSLRSSAPHHGRSRLFSQTPFRDGQGAAMQQDRAQHRRVSRRQPWNCSRHEEPMNTCSTIYHRLSRYTGRLCRGGSAATRAEIAATFG